jgi:uncharacterized protein (DUF608 family)
MWRSRLGRASAAMTVAFALAAPAAHAQSGGAEHWSFEDGSLDGWQVTSGGFDRLIDDRPDFRNRGIPFNKEGTYYLSTMERNDGTFTDGFTGVVQSPRFTLTRPIVSMLVAGGASDQQYVAVCTVDPSAPDGCHEVARTSGPEDEVLQYKRLDVSEALGQTAFVEVVDHATGGWGHISLDDVRANAPAMPRDVTARHDQGGVTLGWKADDEPGIAGYDVLRSTSFDSGYAKLGSTTGTTYRDTSAKPGDRYFYRVQARATDGTPSEPNVRFAREAQDLEARGATRTYAGDHLSAIRFPVGPLGSGGIVHDGTGARPTWWIFNNNDYPANNDLDGVGNVPNSFFAVRARSAGGAPVVRALQTKPDGPFAGMQSLDFQGEYPMATYRFHDDALPVRVTERIDSPFIPGDLRNSAVPAAIYEITLTNTSSRSVRASLLGTQQNAVGFDGYGKIGGPDERSFPGYGANANAIDVGKRDARLQMTGANGSMTLSALASKATGTASWGTEATLHDAFAASGAVSGPASAKSPQGQTVDGALAVERQIPPGKSVTIPFVLSWYFPQATHFYADGGEQYTNWWSSAADVDAYVRDHFADLQGRTQRYHDTFYDSNIPHYVLDRLTSTTALLHTPTVFWTKGGFFGAEEGYGCCFGMPDHVWEYAQGQARLWPQVGRTWTSQYLDDEQPNGVIDYRHGIPEFAMDGQTGVILGAYRDYLNTGDPAWLKGYWPKIRSAMDYVVGTFDADHDGMLEGAQYNTLDTSESGTGPWMGSMYLAAVDAAGRMATAAGDATAAAAYEQIYAAGRSNQESALWNGSFYEERSQHLPGQRAIDDGVDIDMLLGQWWAGQLGLGDIYDSAHMTTAADTLFRENFQEDFIGDNPYYHLLGRNYVERTDAGMLNITWPKHDRPLDAPPYFDETWTGTEYVAAATMIARGQVDHGLRVMRAVDDRYDGRLRNDRSIAFGGCATGQGTGNPFSDDECGKWYGRSLSSWSVLLALQGFTYDGVSQTIGIAPQWRPRDHRSFFTAGDAWGTLVQKRSGSAQTDRLVVRSGAVTLRHLRLHTPGSGGGAPRADVDGKAIGGVTASRSGDTVTLTFGQPVMVRAGQVLTARA